RLGRCALLRLRARASGRGSARRSAAAHRQPDGENRGARGMIYSRITGTGSYLPPRVMTNAEFAARLDTSDAWIRERTGIVQRHIADPAQGSSDLALHANRRALDAAGVGAESIDLIVLATSTP